MTREEAIEVYNGLINTKIKEAFEFFAPELAESEDERIRKELANFLRSPFIKENLTDEKVAPWIAYLEKQKEQTPAEWSEEDEKTRRNLMSLLANMRGNRITEETYQKYYPWLKDLHPSWKPSGEQMQYLQAVINDPNNAGAESCHLILESLYNDLKEL